MHSLFCILEQVRQQTIAMVTFIFQSEAPLETSEGHVPETWRENAKQLMRAEYAIQVVSHRVKAILGLILVCADAFVLPEFYRSAAKERKEPIPCRESKHCQEQYQVQYAQESHHLLVLLEQVALLDGCYRHKHVATANCQVQKEEQEVAIVLQSYTIIDPGTVMIHQERASATHFAMVCTRWFDFFTVIASFRPELLQLIRSFASVSQQLLYITSQTFKAAFSVFLFFKYIVNGLAIGTILLLGSHLFDHLKIFRTAWLDDHCPKVIE